MTKEELEKTIMQTDQQSLIVVMIVLMVGRILLIMQKKILREHSSELQNLSVSVEDVFIQIALVFFLITEKTEMEYVTISKMCLTKMQN